MKLISLLISLSELWMEIYRKLLVSFLQSNPDANVTLKRESQRLTRKLFKYLISKVEFISFYKIIVIKKMLGFPFPVSNYLRKLSFEH